MQEVVERDADILFYGDSNFTCRHPGNLSFVQCVKRCLTDYRESGDMGKLTICNGIVEGLAARNPPARFLKRDIVLRDWVKLSKSDAIIVTAHAFVALVFQEEEARIQQIDAMIVDELTSDPSQEFDGPPTVESAIDGEADDPFRNSTMNKAGRANGDGASTLYTATNFELDSCSPVMNVHMETEVYDTVVTTTQREADFTSRQLARRVSIDFESTSFVTEGQCDFVKQLPIRRRVSDSSESDTDEPISDDGQHSDGYWEGLNTRDFDDLKGVLGCDEDSLLS